MLYLSKIGAMKLEGGFLVLYNAMAIKRTKELRLRYKQEDYRMLNEFYKQKIQQIHIVGEYANLMVRDLTPPCNMCRIISRWTTIASSQSTSRATGRQR